MQEEIKLLLVDDDSLNLMQMYNILQSDYNVFAVKDGSSALKKVENFLPDLILMDINMPDMSGFDVLAKLKTSDKTKDIPVIFISGMNGETEGKGLSLGAVDFIHKPFDPTVVKLRIRNQIQVANMRRTLSNQ